jgi:hypothetical protein
MPKFSATIFGNEGLVRSAERMDFMQEKVFKYA